MPNIGAQANKVARFFQLIEFFNSILMPSIARVQTFRWRFHGAR